VKAIHHRRSPDVDLAASVIADGPAGARRRTVAEGTGARYGWLRRVRGAVAQGRWLPVWDALAAAGVIAIARAPNTSWAAPAVGAAVATPILLAALSEYQPDATVPGRRLTTARELTFAAPVILLVALAFSRGSAPAHVDHVIGAAALLALAWVAARLVISTAHTRRRTRALVIGSGVAARRVAELAGRHRENCLDVVGLLDDVDPQQPTDGPPILGRLAEIERVVREHEIDRVIVSFTRRRDADLVGLIRLCHPEVAVDVVPRLFDVIKPDGYLLGGLPLANATPSTRRASNLALKRTLDLVGATMALIVCAPVMAAIAIAARITDPGPVLFWQERIGRGGQPFRLPKFRTMAEATAERPIETDSLGIADLVERMKNEEKDLIPIGAWLRRTSLDELPQLWCVFTGKMSFVGPRPLRPFEVDALDAWQRERLILRPGITGLWPVLGRSETSWEERMRLDNLYTRHWSIAFDVRIMLRTVPAVLRRRGAL
jgi:exopolysaccharide biosynthesis polyprenyl glycosylphosphotransferase